MKQLSIVLPCYNEAKNIPELLEKFSKVIKHDMELVLVNNGSTDNSAEVLKKELPKYRFARTVLVPKNRGYGYGILFGLKREKGEYLAFSHADLQCDPADIIRAYATLKKQEKPELTLVKGNRKGRRNLLTSGLHLIAALLFFHRFDDINGQPKIFHKSLLKKMKNPAYDFNFDFYVQYIAVKNSFSVISIPVVFGKRKHGISNWAYNIKSRLKTVSKYIKYIIKLRFSG